MYWFLLILVPGSSWTKVCFSPVVRESFSPHSCASVFLSLSGFLLFYVPFSHHPCASVFLSLSGFLLVHGPFSPHPCASVVLSLIGFFLGHVPVSLHPLLASSYPYKSFFKFQFFLVLVTVSPHPHAGFSLSSGFFLVLMLISPCLRLINILVSSCSASSLRQYSYSYSASFFLSQFLLSSNLILFSTRYILITLN